MSTAYVYFSISGKNLIINDVTNNLHLEPTESGENRLGEKYWDYKIEAKDANEGLDKALASLIEALNAKSETIKAYASRKNIYTKVFIVIYGKNEQSNGVFFDHTFIKFLNDLGAEIEIEVYND